MDLIWIRMELFTNVCASVGVKWDLTDEGELAKLKIGLLVPPALADARGME